MNKKTIIINLAVLATGLILGALFFRGGHDHDAETAGAGEHAGHAEATTWTCSMHPQIQQPKPGKCPICAMDLIPLGSGSGKAGRPRELTMSPQAKELAKIATAPVERRLVEAEVRMVGKVEYDETRKKTVAAWFPARIDRLYVDYTGIDVTKGDHLASVYSPELLTAQQELLSAVKYDKSEVQTMRDKLRLWGFPEDRIRAIEQSGKIVDRMDINTPLGGTVIQKHINEGDYVKTGSPLFEIADLSRVWVQLDAYETDLPWLRYGQPVTFEVEGVPGQKFDGIIAEFSPALDPMTRTVKVRVNAENPRQLMTPGMFVRATALAKLAGGGKVVALELKDKWISPMHPEIIRDEPGDCPICGMKLVKAEEIGYAFLDKDEEQPLVVPTSAVLKTGKRSLVYVEVPDREEPTYEGREILVGPRAGDIYIVEEGLMEGERVVVQGNFKIDSALQIVAKPSMMNPGGGGGGGGHQHGVHGGGETAMAGATAMERYEVDAKFQDQVGALLHSYFTLEEALAADDLGNAKKTVAGFGANLGKVDMALLTGEAHMAWMGQVASLKGAVEAITSGAEIEDARAGFKTLSDALTDSVMMFGVTGHEAVYQLHCPMAFKNSGASWLQKNAEVRNPYFGARMLKCGEVKTVWGEGRGAKAEGGEKGK